MSIENIELSIIILPEGASIAHEDGLSVLRDSEGFLLGLGTDDKSTIRAVYGVLEGRRIARKIAETVIFKGGGE